MRNKKETLPVLLCLALGVLLSCNSTKLINQSIGDDQIIADSTECGSYEVRSDGTTIGYIVKPFVVEIERAKKITEFERKLKIKYKAKFNKDYRSYTFTTDRVGDIILMTAFLSPKEVENIPNWKCELQEVHIYPKSTEWIYYNCSKKRFKVPGATD